MPKASEPHPGSPSPDADGGFAELVRHVDPDRFLMALAAPAAARGGLIALAAFNHELVRAVELPSARSGAGPIAGLIRLQWWREVVQGGRDDWRSQPAAIALRALIDAGRVRTQTLLDSIAGREAELEGTPDRESWRRALLDGPGGLQRAAGELLGVASEAADRLAATGAAYAIGALHRHLPSVLASGRCPLSDQMLQEAGSSRAAPDITPELVLGLCREGKRMLGEASGPALPRAQRAALLPLVLARRDLRRPGNSARPRGLGDRLAVLNAVWRP